MKSRSLLIFFLVFSLAVLPSVQLTLAKSTTAPYSERVDIYAVGSTDYWLVTLNSVNSTNPSILAAEGVSGVNGYQLTAVQASTASPSSPFFWADGYGIAKLPFMPYSGVFLTVNATSQSAAQSAASSLNSLFGVNFTPVSSTGGNYTFYSPVDFKIAEGPLFASVPAAAYKGLAAIADKSSLAADPVPTLIFSGVRSNSGFTHSVSFGANEPNAVGTNGTLNLQNALNLSNSTFVSASNANSTTVVIHSLDGFMKTTDKATLTNNIANFSSRYSFTVPPGTRFKPNVTLFQNPPALTATRTVSGSPGASGGLITLTLSFANTANNGTITNISVNDSWWSSHPSLFSLSAGNSSFTIPSLAAGRNVSRAYVLKVASSSTEDLIAPATPVSYSYTFGNLTVKASTKMNEAEVRTNGAGSSLFITAGSDIASGSSFGKPGHYIVSVTNAGTSPALNLNVLNFTNPTLTPGVTWKFNLTLPETSLAIRNVTKSFTLGWTSPDGTKGTLVSNPATVILTHTTVQLPIVEFKLTAPTSAQALASGNINASYALTNKGSIAANNVIVNQSLPAGMTCKSVVTGKGTCGPAGFILTNATVASFGNVTGTIQLAFSKDNYITPGATVVTTQNSGLVLRTTGSVLTIVAGVSATKTFSPNKLFVGQKSNVSVQVTNQGSLTLYNSTITAGSDSFDIIVSGSLTAQRPALENGATQALNYTAKMTSSGNHTGAPVSLSFVFGGFKTQYPASSGTVLVFQGVVVKMSALSSPKEGVNFPLAVNIQNPSSVGVSNVTITISVPQGLNIVNSSSSGFKVAGRMAMLSVPSLAAGATLNRSLTLRADFDSTFNLGTGSASFNYLGSTINGSVSSSPIVVGVDTLLRYELPIGAAVLMTLAVAYYLHRKLSVPTK